MYSIVEITLSTFWSNASKYKAANRYLTLIIGMQSRLQLQVSAAADVNDSRIKSSKYNCKSMQQMIFFGGYPIFYI